MKNFFAAFADGAVLFPILAALTMQNGFSGTLLLASAGIAYWIAGIVFRVPMPVQPLKSIAIAAMAVGATQVEVSISGIVLGLIALALVFVEPDRIADRIPISLVHALQLGLGVLLVFQGLKSSIQFESLFLAAALLVLPALLQIPLLGVTAFGGLIWAVFLGASSSPSDPVSTSVELPRTAMVFSLVLPQLALTLTNSVLGTRDVARRYYGQAANRVSAKNLLISIGAGNIISGVVGGLPFCHGSGGVTAHARAGATHWISNGVIGTVLLLLSGAYALGQNVGLAYPPMLLSALLVAVGIHHVRLAAPTWSSHSGKLKLLVVAIAVALTRNMLWALLAGAMMESAAGFHAFRRRASES